MQVINATKGDKKRTLLIMLDRGQTLEILPGQVSQVFTPSVNTLKAVINSGSSDEIGIVFGGSWEESIGNQVTGGFPYYYTNMEEAKAKLFAEAPVESAKSTSEVYTDNSAVIEDLQNQVNELTTKISEYKSKEADWELDHTKLQASEKENESLKAELKQLQSEFDGTKSDLNDYKNKYADLEQSNAKTIEQNKLLNQQNEEYATKIESMRTTFNGVCDQFNIKFDETKGWYQPAE